MTVCLSLPSSSSAELLPPASGFTPSRTPQSRVKPGHFARKVANSGSGEKGSTTFFGNSDFKKKIKRNFVNYTLIK